MTVNFVKFSDLIRKVRKQARLSQFELSELAGVGKTLVFDLEKGRGTVSLSNFLKVCRVLNIKVQLVPPVPFESDNPPVPLEDDK